jgi:hypothetical protein
MDARGLPHGFLKDGDMFTTIDVPGATNTQAFGINAAGQIVGMFGDGTGNGYSFVATPDDEGDTTPPIITVAASPATLSPPNGKRVAITVSGTITASGGSG